MKRNSANRRSKTRQIAIQPPHGHHLAHLYYWWPVTDEKIHQASQQIVEAVHPEQIILFGSFAYGTPTPDSDVDLLVIMDSDQTVHVRSVQLSEILYPRPFPVDIIVRTPAEVKERLALGDSFFQEIMTKGRVLYERPSD